MKYFYLFSVVLQHFEPVNEIFYLFSVVLQHFEAVSSSLIGL